MITLPPGTRDIVRAALAEDIGTGDVTTAYTVPSNTRAAGVILAKSAGTVAGLPVAAMAFTEVDPTLACDFHFQDGDEIAPGDALFTVSGLAQSILTAERVALNFLQRLSGIATKTRAYVDLIEGTSARIVDTRKTTPGLRILEKYAVRAGGGYNHRFGLYDAVLIKDNHIAACGGISAAVSAAYSSAPHTMTVTVECDTLDQVAEAVEAGADIILLDNMSPDMLARAVDQIGGAAAIEASGGISEQTVAAVARAGVGIISVGSLTHGAVALDISLDLRLT